MSRASWRAAPRDDAAAVERLAAGKSGTFAALAKGVIAALPLEQVLTPKPPPDPELVRLAHLMARSALRRRRVRGSRAVEQGRDAGAHHLGVEPRARLRGAALRVEVNVHDPEPLRVAEAPFVVIEQRPGEIAPQVDAAADRLEGGPQVPPIVLDPRRVFHTAVQDVRRIGKGGTVLGDIERQLARPFAHPEQRLGETGRMHLPPGFRVDALW